MTALSPYLPFVALSKEQIPAATATSIEWREFADELVEVYLSFFNLERALITFSLEESKALENYLYAVKLIIDCKNAAVRVSRRQWQAIESRLLTPQE